MNLCTRIAISILILTIPLISFCAATNSSVSTAYSISRQEYTNRKNALCAATEGADTHALDEQFNSSSIPLIGTKFGWSILEHAARRGSFEAMRHLIEKKGIDPLHPEYADQHLLVTAAYSGITEKITYLVARYPALYKNINTPNKQGTTPIIAAVQSGSIPAVEYLLTLAGDITIPSERGWSAAHAAAISGNPFMIERVRTLAPALFEPESLNKNRASLLYLASYSGHPWAVQYCIEELGYTTHETAYARSLLFGALKAGICNPSLKEGWQPEHTLVQFNPIKVISYLAQQGVDVNAPLWLDKDDCVSSESISHPLAMALHQNEWESVRTLLKYGTRIPEDKRQTLELFIQEGTLDNPDSLVFRDYTKFKKFPEAPAVLAAIGLDTWGIFEDVLEHNTSPDTSVEPLSILPIVAAARRGNFDSVQLSVNRYGATTTSVDKNGFNALYYAILHEKPDMVDFLCKKSQEFTDEADMINTRYADGSTALMEAAHAGDVKIASILIENGADLHATDNCGNDVHRYAVISGGHKMIDFIQKWNAYTRRQKTNA